MKCQEFVDFLMAYLDRELPAEQQASFDAHIQQCPCCRDYLETYRQAVQMGKKCHNCEEDGQTLSTQVPEDFIQAILRARQAEG